MTAGFKYFKSTDSGAPTLNNAVGSFISVLDWALDISDPVNGWQKVYTGTNKAAYRPRAGLRYYLRVDESIAGTYALVRGYESMTDVDTGVDPFPLLTKFAIGAFSISKTASNVATARAYWGIKTARYVIIVIRGNASNTTDNYVYAFGEVPTIHTGENYPFVVTGIGNGLANYAGNSGLMSIASTTALGGGTYAPANSGFSGVLCWARNPSGSVKGVAGQGVVSGTVGYSIADGSRVALRRFDIQYSATQLAPGVAIGTQTPRSYMPHLWSTSADLNGATWVVGDNFAMPDYNAGANFIYMGENNGVSIILETTDTAGAM